MIEQIINKINDNANIAIYGAGTVAKKLKEYIDENKPSANIKFLLIKQKKACGATNR